jgi:hypothetical protein
MQPIHVARNLYRGINAHLHSHWQAQGGWDTFHTNHITDLMRLMNAALEPLGYIADIEQSLQIRRAGQSIATPESDVTIYDTRPERPARSTALPGAQAVAVREVMRLDEELSEYRAVAIYAAGQGRGQPVAWVELLSPSNKPGGQDSDYYQQKRLRPLRSGVVFVEMDYLHHSAPTFEGIPRYASAGLNGHPYLIVVVDPRPAFEDGVAFPYYINVDEPLPVVNIPLNAGDQLHFDFGAAYDKTLLETRYAARLVDYTQLPEAFHRYTEADQARILCRMLAVIEAGRRGDDLEHSAVPLPDVLPLAKAQQQYDELLTI